MRLERRILRLNDELARLRSQRELVSEELRYHEHLNDDAQRDAAVSDAPIDRADARATADDVERFQRSVAALDARIERLTVKRDDLVSRLG